jgi:sucrose phosphorylase
MNGDTTKLTAWAKTIEKISDRATYLNITATHDGIGVRPTEGILTEAERKQLVDLAYAHGGQVSGKRNADGTVSPYELNLNYFDAVNDPGADEPLETQIKRFMVSQAIPLAFIGIPGIYIHSLVGLRNDTQAVKDTGIARRINRAKLSLTSLRGEFRDKNSLRRRVFEEYKRLLKIRRAENAFHPNAAQDVLDLGAEVFALKRTSPEDGEVIVAIHNLSNHDVTVDLRSALRGAACKDLLAPHQAVGIKNQLRLSPYQVCWLKTTAN